MNFVVSFGFASIGSGAVMNPSAAVALVIRNELRKEHFPFICLIDSVAHLVGKLVYRFFLVLNSVPTRISSSRRFDTLSYPARPSSGDHSATCAPGKVVCLLWALCAAPTHPEGHVRPSCGAGVRALLCDVQLGFLPAVSDPEWRSDEVRNISERRCVGACHTNYCEPYQL